MAVGSTARVSRRSWLHRSVLAWALAATGLAAQAATATVPTTNTVVVVGDSLSAEYGLSTGSGWVHLLDQRLAALHPAWHAVNASISGDTTSGGRTRLPALLAAHHPKVVVIELGGNDALRGTPLKETRANVDAMVAAAQAAGAKVMIAGIQVPPNFGRQYTEQFAAMYVDAAKAGHAALLPFVLKGIADRPDADDWFQADRIHPVAKAHPLILENVWPVLKPLLK